MLSHFSRGGFLRNAAVVGAVLGTALFLNCKQGHRPDTAAVPNGPSSGAVGVEYTFSSSAEDHDGDDVAIRFDWGDGDTSDWSQWVRPGDTVAMSHAWSVPGAFPVRARAKARNFTISDWSDGHALVVTGTWTKVFGGPGEERGFSVQQTQDRGYIVAGYTESYGAGGRDAWLIKTDGNGDTIWTRTYGGAGSDAASSVQQTRDGGYVFAGTTNSYGAGGCDIWLVKTDSSGSKVWDKTYGGASDDICRALQQTNDDGYVIGGYTRSFGTDGWDVWFVKTDASGDTVWARTFGGTGGDLALSVGQARDGGYVVAGCTESYGAGGTDVWLVKTDAAGDTVWTRTFGGTADDDCNAVQTTSDGGCIIAGSTHSYGVGHGDVWFIKADANGGKVWDRVFGGQGPDYGKAVQPTSDGGYILFALNGSLSGGDAPWLLKTDANGDTVWTQVLGGAEARYGNAGQQTQDGGYIIAGHTYSYGAGDANAWLIKTDAEGRVDEGFGK